MLIPHKCSRMATIEFSPGPGTNIIDAADYAIALKNGLECYRVIIEFNGVKVDVEYDDKPGDVLGRWNDGLMPTYADAERRAKENRHG